MTQEIIEMARQAGLHIATDVNWMPIIGLEYAEKLIALARADAREACAKVADGWPDYDVQGLAEAIRKRGQE